MRNRFDEQISIMSDSITEMASMIESAIAGAVSAIIKNDKALAQKVFDSVDEIYSAEREIERMCLKLLLHQHPVARDLRLISATLKMITDMRRIGVQAGDICEIALTSDSLNGEYLPERIKNIAHATIEMVNSSTEAFVNSDLELAYKVNELDSVVDDLFVQIKNDLIETIRTNAKGSEQAIDILMIAKYLEKIGDHANNISEWAAFSITGKHRE